MAGFDVEIRDKVAASITAKLKAMQAAAAGATASVANLRTGLAGLGTANVALVGATGRATRGTRQFATSQKAANTAVIASSRGFLGLLRNLRTIAGIAAVIGATRGFVEAIDSFTNLQNKLKGVVGSYQELIEVTDKVNAAANRARVPITDVGKTFRRLDLAIQSLGGSQRESLEVTETASKALVLQGSTVGESASALLQLSQAFNKGKLDGDEFRSIMELMPTVMLEVQKTLGITRAELFDFAKEGKITSNVLRQAFRNIKDAIDKAFEDTDKTLGQALTVLGNNLITFLGRLDRSIGFMKGLSNAFITLANNLDRVLEGVKALTAALLVMASPRILRGVIALGVAFKSLIIAHPIIAALTAITGALVLFRNKIKLSADGLVTLEDVAVGTFNTIKRAVSLVGVSIREAFRTFDFSSLEAALGSVGTVLFTVARGIRAVLNFIGQISFALGKTFAQSTPKDFWDLFLDAGRLAFNQLKIIGAEVFNFLARVFVDAFKRAVFTLTAAMHDFAIAFEPLLNKIGLSADALRHAAGFVEQRTQNLEPIQLRPEELQLKQFSEAGQRAAANFNEAFRMDIVGDLFRDIKSLFAPLGDAIRAASSERILATGTAFERIGLAIRDATIAMQQFNNSIPSPSDIVDPAAFRQAVEQGIVNQFRLAGEVMPQIFLRASQAMQQVVTDSGRIAGSQLIGIFREVAQQIRTSFAGLGPGLFDSIVNAARVAGAKIAQALGPAGAAITGAQGAFAAPGLAPIGPLGQFDTATKQAAGSIGNTLGDLGNTFNFFETTVNNVFSHLGDAISEFARTGKFDFKKFISSILEDMLRFLTNQLAKQFLGLFSPGGGAFTGAGGFGGLGGGLFGGGLFGGGLFGGGLLGALFGFQHGGFTGGRKNEIRGVVHGQEFVVPASAASANRVALESLRRTGKLPSSEGGGTTVSMNVEVINQSSAKMEVQRLSETDVRIIAEDVVSKRAGNVVAQEIQNPNSNVSKSILSSTNAKRRR